MSDIKKRAERNGKVMRTISKIEQTIAKLERMKDEYMQKAVDARSRGETASYNLAKSGINATLTQEKRAKEMLLNIRITAELQKMGDTNADFLKGMSTIAKRISKINRQSDFVKLQKEINKALSGMEEAQAGLDGFLQNSDAAFAAIATAPGALSDEKLDEYISGKVSEKELMFDSEIDALTGNVVAPENNDQTMTVRVGDDEGRQAIAKPFPTPSGSFDFKPAVCPTVDMTALCGVDSAVRDLKLLDLIDTQSEPSVILGKDEGGNIARLKLSDAPHITIGGTLGSGKSSLLHGLVCSSALELGSDVRLLLFDIGGRELGMYNGMSVLASDVITDTASVIPALTLLDDEIDRRYALLSSAGAKDVAEYNRRTQKALPYIIVVFDEFADCIKTLDKFENAYCRLARQSAQAGVYTVLCSRVLTPDVFTPAVLANTDARIAFRTANKAESELIVGTDGAEDLELGSILCASGDAAKYVVPHITEKERAAVCSALKGDVL